MLEIFFLFRMCKALGNMLRAKGRNPLTLQILLPICWFLSEFLCAFLAAIIQAVLNHGAPGGLNAVVYIAGFAGALASAGIIFLIAHLLKPKPTLAPSATAFPVQPISVNPNLPPIRN